VEAVWRPEAGCVGCGASGMLVAVLVEAVWEQVGCVNVGLAGPQMAGSVAGGESSRAWWAVSGGSLCRL
jgi:ABC-type uncharacterized transport system permease subunit